MLALVMPALYMRGKSLSSVRTSLAMLQGWLLTCIVRARSTACSHQQICITAGVHDIGYVYFRVALTELVRHLPDLHKGAGGQLSV